MDERLVTYLRTRRTIPAAMLGEPGPDPETLRELLKIAARVPDHGKLAPWRFIVFRPTARAKAIEGLVKIAERHSDEKERRYRSERAKGFADAPLVVGVISSPIQQHPKIPLWEQQLSSANAAMTLVHAANAFGFSANWLTGWYAYDDEAKTWLGLRPGEQVTGFIHIGTPMVAPAERDRPDVEKLTTEWTAGA